MKIASQGRPGFTLIELSIVLVIIGLIVGAILAGQNMVTTAAVRATVTQAEKYNTAVNVFRGKFNALPGDIAPLQAQSFGLFQLTGTGVAMGNNNGLLEGFSGSTIGCWPNGENLTFWRHLTDAQLIDGSYGVSGNSALDPATGQAVGAVSTVANSLPPAKLGRGLSFEVWSSGGFNSFELAPIQSISGGGDSWGSSGMSPNEAYAIDAKLDDGIPTTGYIQALGFVGCNSAPSVAATPTSNNCTVGTNGAVSNTYNLSANNGQDNPSCAVGLKFR